MTIQQSAAHNQTEIPVFGAIVDISPILHYIQRLLSLDVVAQIVGIEDFIELMFMSCVSESGDADEDIDSLFMTSEIERIKEKDVSIDELHYEIAMLNNFIHGQFLGELSERTQENFDEFGCQVSKWLSRTDVILESYCTEYKPSGSLRAIFRDKEFSAVGSDRRLIRHSETLRRKTGITSFDVPY